MEFTQYEIDAMRNELACNAVQSLARLLEIEHPRCEALAVIAEHLHVTTSTVRNMFEKAPREKYRSSLLECAASHDIKIYWYQFYPTAAICNMWLEHCYRCDRGVHRSKWQFKYWDRKMPGSSTIIDEELAA